MRARLGPPLPGVIYLTARTEKPPPAPGVLGALNKPFNPATLVAALEDLCGAKNHASGDGVDRLAGVRAEFLRALPAAAAVIAAHQAALSEVWRPEAAAALLAQAHTLAGSAGLFGRHALGTAAAEVEGQLIKYRKLSRAPDVQETHALQQAITALTAACRD